MLHNLAVIEWAQETHQLFSSSFELILFHPPPFFAPSCCAKYV